MFKSVDTYLPKIDTTTPARKIRKNEKNTRREGGGSLFFLDETMLYSRYFKSIFDDLLLKHSHHAFGSASLSFLPLQISNVLAILKWHNFAEK